MKTAAIIAEFNPFHNGHKYLIDKAREITKADNIIVIMSGDFTQRGTPAIIDKFTRAKMAVCAGADMVIELPVFYATASAGYFAKASINILSDLNIVDFLCFGVECDNLDAFYKISNILSKESFEYKTVLKTELSKGSSFAKARSQAVLACIDKNDADYDDISNILMSPNNVLALEYIIALKSTTIKPLPVKRLGSDYNDDKINNHLSSAKAIRNLVYNQENYEKIEDLLKSNIPDESFVFFEDSVKNKNVVFSNDFSRLLKYKLILEKKYGFEKYNDVSVEISNSILKICDYMTFFEDFCMDLKSKNFTYSRISRCLCHILLNIYKEEFDKDCKSYYCKILAFNKTSTSLLKEINKKSIIPVINKYANAKKMLGKNGIKVFLKDIEASEIYHIINDKDYNEYTITPFIYN
ncbi:cytidyltransferase-like domain-containing protein [Acetitomaculum ruminis DSM 5522]|uniref:tRNA(Met) cytidine acetate ligase n=1 Tax=Acetitomaculum ruminis DSM 5522 TaxID=1120918 RepID=A0A1I0XR42_9FIRM|nr:nucleotidyltransferase [Acetitomaculum ruminis]SFB03481.1 cytidyltransferase-like domain-containing protein [Acetitomaculum ruminis DSM 5522]